MTTTVLALSLSGCLGGLGKSGKSSLKRSRGLDASMSAGDASHIQYFGYYGSGDTNIDDWSGHANLVVDTGDIQDPPIKLFEAKNIKYNVLVWSDISDADWPVFIKKVNEHRNFIASFHLADEPGCDSATNAKFEARIKKLKSTFPEIPTQINYYINGSFIHQLELYPAFDCKFPEGLDWISFDNYGPWKRDSAAEEIPTILKRLHEFMKPNQRVFLTPHAFIGSGVNSEAEVIDLAQKYYDLAVSDPSVIGLIPWIWEGFGTDRALKNLPEARAKYLQIGQAITGKSDSATGNRPPRAQGRTPDPVFIPPTVIPPLTVPPAPAMKECPIDANGWDGTTVCTPWVLDSCASGGYTRKRACAANYNCRTTDFNGNGTPLNFGEQGVNCGTQSKLACPVDGNGVDGTAVCSAWTFQSCGGGGTYTRVRTCDEHFDCRTSDVNGFGAPLNFGQAGVTSCPQ